MSICLQKASCLPVCRRLPVYLSAEGALVEEKTVGDQLQHALNGEHRGEEVVELAQRLERFMHS